MEKNIVSNATEKLENIGIILTGLSSTFGSMSVSDCFDNRASDMFLFLEQLMDQTANQLNTIISELMIAANKI